MSAISQASAEENRCWDQYWQSGHRGCFDAQAGSAEAALVDHLWKHFFADAADGQRVLDLCSGNGAVARLAADSAGRGNVEWLVVGIDSAAIAPPGGDDRATLLRFVRGSALRLPFSDVSFDLVTSQFGIEYLPRERAVTEAMRVLKPGGRGLWLVHASEGLSARAARAELGDIDELLEELRIFPAALDALGRVCDVERSRKPPPRGAVDAAKKAHDVFQARLAKLASGWRQRRAMSVYRDTGSILQHTYRHRAEFPLDVLLAKVNETEQSVIAHKDRLRQLCDAAIDRAGCTDLARIVRHHGASDVAVEALQAPAGSGQLGWVFSIAR